MHGVGRWSRAKGCGVAPLLLVVTTTVAGCRTTGTEPVVPADGYGFSVGASQIWMSAEDANRELDAAAKTSARWMRVHSQQEQTQQILDVLLLAWPPRGGAGPRSSTASATSTPPTLATVRTTSERC